MKKSANEIIACPVLKGKTVTLRPVEETDAAFILSLRLDKRNSAWLTPTDSDPAKQKRWIAEYKERERQGLEYYFIIECREAPCGTIRIYDLRPDSFGWGSWILKEDRTPSAALESMMLVYGFGFEVLKLPGAHFEVMKGNHRALNIHKKMGALQTGEDERKYYYRFSQSAYYRERARHQTLLRILG